MELTDLKRNNTNTINVTDSLNAPLLRLEIKNGQNTIIPEGNDLIIYVDNAEETNENRKTFIFTLAKPLKYLNEISDRFIMEPKFENGKVKIHTYVERNINDDAVLIEPEYEELDNQLITLFEGNNYISTNYSNALLEIVYPKNSDVIKYLLNSMIYAGNKEGQVLTLDDIYFKDCFTEVDGNINETLNKLTVKCFNSTNGKFSMDCDGNLIVNTITALSGNNNNSDDLNVNSITSKNNAFSIDLAGNIVANSITLNNYSNILNKIYPVGSIYMSVSGENPGNLFGGTWESWGNGRVPVSLNVNDGDFNTCEKTGGTKYHNHLVGAHSHNLDGTNAYAQVNYTGARAYLKGRSRSNWTPTDGLSGMSTYNQRNTMNWAADVYGRTEYSASFNTGDGTNLPPYITCYMWKRVA